METKPVPRSPEWMAMIRQKSQAKAAERRKIKEAEKLKKTTTHSQKLKEANDVLNPKPAEPTPEAAVENEPLPKKTKAPTWRPMDLENEAAPGQSKKSYKEEYYKRKLELLDRQPQQPPSQPQQGNPAYALAKHEIKQHVDRNVMKQVWSELFSGTECPY